MYKLLTLTVFLLITTVTGFPQRNDGGRNPGGDSIRNPKIERERGGTVPVINPNNSQRERRNDNQTIIYPKTPQHQEVPEVSIPIEGTCIINPTLPSPKRYDTPRLSSVQIAMQLFKLGDYYEASLKFTEWLVNSPDDINALFYRGMCYYEMEWYGYAIEDFNIVIRTDLEYAEAYYYRGLSRFLRNERERAEIDLEIAYELGIEIAGIMLKKYFW